MGTAVQTTGEFRFVDWKEETVSASDGDTAPKLARASVTNTYAGGIQAADTACEYTIVYVTAETGTFAGMQRFEGSLDGRTGTFAVEERGTFDATGSVRCAFEVVPGSGTGRLAGLSGSGSYVTKPGESAFPYRFAYELD